MTIEERKIYLVRLLNEAINKSEPVSYKEFNSNLHEAGSGYFEAIESLNPKLGIKKVGLYEYNSSWAISVASMIATITDILIDDRLCFIVDDNGYIVGVNWCSNYKEEKKAS